jgi:hypothetical protein
MGKNQDKYTRKKGSDKKKNTFNKYGKYTSKGIRHLQLIKANSIKNQLLERIEY